MLDIKIQKIRDNAILPKYAHGTEDTGADLFISNIKALNNKGEFEEIKNPDGYSIAPFKTVLCGVGFKMAVPVGYDVQIRPTSGNSLKTPLRIPNSPATIDSGFRGEVAVIIQNVSDSYYKIKIGDKIAQMVIAKVEHANFIESDTLEASARGDDGYGSTGIAGESEKSRYKPGDKIALRDDLVLGEKYGDVCFTKTIKELKNTINTVLYVNIRYDGERYAYVTTDGYIITEEMIDHEKSNAINKPIKFDMGRLSMAMLLGEAFKDML